VSDRTRNLQTAALAILAALVILGIALADDYGPSWDEVFNDQAGLKAIRAYSLGSFLTNQHDDYIHGTFYFMIYAGASRFLASLPLGLERVEVRHFLNYLTFLLAVWACHHFVRGMLGRRAAYITAILMVGQPLYFGHAFINQKDMPFLAFFTASIAFGVSATRAIQERVRRISDDPRPRTRTSLASRLASMRAAWHGSSRSARIGFVLLGMCGAALTVELLAESFVYPSLERMLDQAYAGQASESVNRLFQAVAEDAHKTPLEIYRLKLHSAYTLLRAIAIPLTVAGLIGTWHRKIAPVRLRLPALQDPAYRSVILAGALLGLTSAIRVIGPFAGLLTGMYMLVRLRKRAGTAILVYGSTAAVVAYLAWPALWGNPVAEFWTRLTGSMSFDQPHDVLFEGVILVSSGLPAHYLPKLLLLQFPAPTLLAIPLGIFMAVRSARRREVDGALIILAVLWFVLPLVAQILLKVPLYGNTRQLLFATVPLLVFAGMGWESVLRALNRRWALGIAILLALAPGVLHIVRFHPYEYVYYNELAGGVGGAEGSFEMDYWCTSYRELVERLNSDAPAGARVAAWGPVEAAAELARPDLIVEPLVPGWEGANYRMACGRGLLDQSFFAGTQVLHEVRRDGVLLGRVDASP
jgi:hypothetical protein